MPRLWRKTPCRKCRCRLPRTLATPLSNLSLRNTPPPWQKRHKPFKSSMNRCSKIKAPPPSAKHCATSPARAHSMQERAMVVPPWEMPSTCEVLMLPTASMWMASAIWARSRGICSTSKRWKSPKVQQALTMDAVPHQVPSTWLPNRPIWKTVHLERSAWAAASTNGRQQTSTARLATPPRFV